MMMLLQALFDIELLIHAAVRLILQLGPKDHVTQGLHQLHWLPIRYRIYNVQTVCTYVHSTLWK